MPLIYETFDTTPTNEDCVQVSQDTDYKQTMGEETKRMVKLLEDKFPDLNGFFDSKWCNHDFGSYQEIRFRFEDTEEGWAEYNLVEDNWPKTWEDTDVIYHTISNDLFEKNEHGVMVFKKNLCATLVQDLFLNGLDGGEVLRAGTVLNIDAGMPYGIGQYHLTGPEVYCIHPNRNRVTFWVCRSMLTDFQEYIPVDQELLDVFAKGGK